MSREVARMSTATADIVLGVPVDAALESPLFYDKLLHTHVGVPAAETSMGIEALLAVVEAEYADTDAVIAEAVAVMKAAIATIGAAE
jgi:hypothetical protein